MEEENNKEIVEMKNSIVDSSISGIKFTKDSNVDNHNR